MYFFIKDDKSLKKVISGIKSVIVLQKDLIVNPPIIKNLWKPK